MSRAISRDTFDPLKNYLGVHMQQGRVLLDADWNEAQDIAIDALRRLARDAIGDGPRNDGFAIYPSLHASRPSGVGLGVPPMSLAVPGHPNFFFLNIPGVAFDAFDSDSGVSLRTPLGQPAVGNVETVEHNGQRFLRVSGHLGPVRLMKRLSADTGGPALAAHEIATFRFRINTPHPGTIKFILRHRDGRETRWRNTNTAFVSGVWLPAFATPLDARFQILTASLPRATVDRPYFYPLASFGGKPSLLAFELHQEPENNFSLSLDGRTVFLEGRPTEPVTTQLRIRLQDANGQLSIPRILVVPVSGSGHATAIDERLAVDLTPLVEVDGSPIDLTTVEEYGIELFQNDDRTLIWDLRDLRVGSNALQQKAARKDFVIRGSRVQTLLSMRVLENAFNDPITGATRDESERIFEETVVMMKSLLPFGDRDAEAVGGFYVDGLPCLGAGDMLYSQQVDPDDPPLTDPSGSESRRDTVYLDVWTEPVTYVEDAAIRDVALGGPDTATRLAVRHRVRVAEGADAPASGNGVGDGRLSTHGTYTGLSNRLYRVEIDGKGDLGSATFRWSDDNASRIGRVIADIPAGSKATEVEDASAFQVGDQILIRSDLDAQEHVIASLAGNTIELVSPCTAFSLASRPRVVRWNAFRVPTEIDPDNPAFSKVVSLNDGVTLRFSGKNFVRGDYWLFTARRLAEQAFTPDVSEGRLELLDCARPRGIVHHYAPLATLIRDGSDPDAAGLVDTIDDLRVARLVVTVDIDSTPSELPDTEFELARLELPDLLRGIYLVRLSGVGTISSGAGGGLLDIACELMASKHEGNRVSSACVDVASRVIHLGAKTGPQPAHSPFEVMAVVSGAPLILLGGPVPQLTLGLSVTRKTGQFIGLSGMQLTVFELMTPINELIRSALPR